LEKQLKRWETIASITTANVALEPRREVKPHFCLRVLPAVPGPDIHAEAREHTFRTALLKGIPELLRQIKTRKSKQLRRRHRQHLQNWVGSLVRHGT
jgi:hypothetical protein